MENCATTQRNSRPIIAFFRDRKTIDAVTSAPPIVRMFLEESGFALTSAAQLPEAEETDDALMQEKSLRKMLASQVTAALSNRALKKALLRASAQTEFDVAAFVSVVVNKIPQVQEPQEPVVKGPVTPRSPSQLRSASPNRAH